MMDRRLEVFYTVAKTGNITKAAHILHMTQPAVTSQIKKFEQYYDVRLLNRHHNGVSLTPIGHSIFSHVEDIRKLHDAIDQKLLSRKDTEGNPSLRIGVTAGAADFLFRVVARRFCDLYGDVDMQIDVDDYESIEYKLEHRNIELALVEDRGMQQRFQVEKIWRDPLMVLMPTNHPLARSSKITVDKLSHYPIICRDDGMQLCEQLLKCNSGSLNIYANFSSMDAVVDAVKLKIGLAVVPQTLIQRLSKSNSWMARNLDPPHIQVLLLIRCDHYQCGDVARKMLGYARCCSI